MIVSKLNIIRRTTFLFLSCFVISCTNYEPKAPFAYNNHPIFTWGEIEFYGNYYGKYNNPNNVISIYLYSDSLKLNEKGSIIGIGQELGAMLNHVGHRALGDGFFVPAGLQEAHDVRHAPGGHRGL